MLSDDINDIMKARIRHLVAELAYSVHFTIPHIFGVNDLAREYEMTWKYIVTLMAALTLTACGGESESGQSPENNSENPANNATENNASPATENNATSENNTGNNEVAGPTYWEDVAPIIEARCANCHIEDGIGPFELQDYEDAKPFASLIAEAVQERTMPPFQPGKECNEFQHDPSLTDEQIQTVNDWVEAGAPEGDESAKGDPLPDISSDGLSQIGRAHV